MKDYLTSRNEQVVSGRRNIPHVDTTEDAIDWFEQSAREHPLGTLVAPDFRGGVYLFAHIRLAAERENELFTPQSSFSLSEPSDESDYIVSKEEPNRGRSNSAEWEDPYNSDSSRGGDSFWR